MNERGFSLIETMIAVGILAVGLLGAAALLAAGMQKIASSPRDLIATQKATEVCFDTKLRQSAPWPEDIKAALQAACQSSVL